MPVHLAGGIDQWNREIAFGADLRERIAFHRETCPGCGFGRRRSRRRARTRRASPRADTETDRRTRCCRRMRARPRSTWRGRTRRRTRSARRAIAPACAPAAERIPCRCAPPRSRRARAAVSDLQCQAYLPQRKSVRHPWRTPERVVSKSGSALMAAVRIIGRQRFAERCSSSLSSEIEPPPHSASTAIM